MSATGTKPEYAARIRQQITGDSAERWQLARSLQSGGMFVKKMDPSPVGSFVLVELLLPDGRHGYSMAGRVEQVRTARPGKPAGMQLQFVKLDPNAQRLLAAYRQHVGRVSQTMQAAPEPEPATPEESPSALGAAALAVDEAPIIGIDLGTTNSCAAVVEDGKPRVIRSRQGYETIPSVIFVEAGSHAFVGHKAQQKMLLNPERAVYGSKRFIGRPYTSREVGTYGHFFRYGLVADNRGMAAAKIDDRVIPLEMVSALILKEIQRMASDALGKSVTRCVVTVPAYFGAAQRKAVVEAGRMAGLTVERVLSEPTAAAVAFGYGRGLDKKVVVYDLGGGTFDVSVLHVSGGSMRVLATDGDPFLGGADFDDRLTEYLCMLIEQQHQLDVRGDAVSIQRVRAAAEVAKRSLSQEQAVTVDLPHLGSGPGRPVSFSCSVSRDQFERLTQDLVMRSLRVVDGVLHEAGLKGSDVDEFVLAGGQSRSPLVHKLLTERFGKEPSKRVHPDHAVAIGAALVANAIPERPPPVEVTDVLPASIHVETADSAGVLLRRGTALPTRTAFALEAKVDADAEYVCTLYRGEKPEVRDNELLGSVRLPSSLADAVAGATAEVVVAVSADGLLELSMHHPSSGEMKSLHLSLNDDGVMADDAGDLEISLDKDGEVAGEADGLAPVPEDELDDEVELELDF